jgi:hypothetical protein
MLVFKPWFNFILKEGLTAKVLGIFSSKVHSQILKKFK